MPYAAQLQRLSQVAAALADAITPDQVAAAIVERGIAGAGARAGAIHLFSADRSSLELVRSAGLSDEQRRVFHSVPSGARAPIAQVARTGDPMFAGRAEAGSRAWAALPLRARGNILGTLALSFAEPRAFTGDDRMFLVTVAQQCALAVDRALLLRAQADASAERAQTAAMLDTMLATTPVGLCFVDRGLHYVRVNEALAAMNGVPVADHLGRHIRDIIPGPVADVVGAAIARVFETGVPITDYDWRGPTSSGEMRHLIASFYPVRDADGAVAWGGVVTVDVTARREAEERLRRQEEHMRVAVDAASLGTWMWDVVADRGVWDDAMCRMLAAPQPEVQHYDFFLSRVHEDDRERMRRVVATAVEALDTYQDEYRVVLPSGEIRWLADHARIFRDDDGRALSVAGVSLDVTDRRRAEEQLRQGQRIESVGRLAGGMAHEINNMMSVVLGFAEFVLRHPELPDEARHDLLEIQKAAERAASVTRQVLAFSRQQVLMPEVLDLNAVVTEGHAMLRRLLGEEIDVALELAPDIGRVRADRNQLIQALVNLCINARDAMPAGGRVTISTARTSLAPADLRREIGAEVVPGDYLALAIGDTGTGMEETILERVFEPFFTTKAVGNGTGLGLSTVYGIVKQSGGYVWARSNPGAGSTFTILLPATSAPASTSEPLRPAAGIEGEGRVLLVEDEPLVRTMARRTLEDLGYSVAEAGTAAQALEQVGSGGDDIRLVITDVIMPGMSGRELGARLAERRPDLPVLFVSGHPSQFVLEQGLLDQGQAFLQKPFLPDVLGAAVRTLLDAVGR